MEVLGLFQEWVGFEPVLDFNFAFGIEEDSRVVGLCLVDSAFYFCGYVIRHDKKREVMDSWLSLSRRAKNDSGESAKLGSYENLGNSLKG